MSGKTEPASHLRLSGQTVLIVGGSSGIGLATAQAVLAAGGRVHIAARTSASLAAARAQLGPDAQTHVCDAASEDAVARMSANLPPLDHLFTTAGAFAPDDIRTTAIDELRAIHDSRLWSCVHIVRHCTDRLRRDGSVTFMSGTASWYPEGAALTSAACGAVQSLARSLAVSMAPLRFNALCPGYTRTALWSKTFGDEGETILASLARDIPIGRAAEPSEIADAALFLMTNAYVNGIELIIDGGARLT